MLYVFLIPMRVLVGEICISCQSGLDIRREFHHNYSVFFGDEIVATFVSVLRLQIKSGYRRYLHRLQEA